MKKTVIAACAAALASASFALADDVIIRQTDPEPTNSVIIKEKQDPDVVIKKKKVIIREDNDSDVTIKGSINVD